ncbi:MAG: glycosyl hydrolase 115 family protein [Duncaniella sp.]|uniref:glycosyl hydrolase 115 family protein n=1 Tax=Duncaniella sp. TaxID=2518496 RepID=UPI0023D43B45|nr:glycosyl hydrolase 115 family protein [Duncaniella sp.]MDE6089891.1 glycosyl hydrolase 115 family protein [Duncaniella sp.]
MIRYIGAALLLLLSGIVCRDDATAAVHIFDGRNPVTFNSPAWASRPVPEKAAEMFESDMTDVTGLYPLRVDRTEAAIRIYNLSAITETETDELRAADIDLSELRGRSDAFCLKVHDGKLYAVGADDRGTAYAILEISRLAGVSPWVWWNDSRSLRRDDIELPDDYVSYQSPSVEYRGIFLNDEDWSLQPWSWRTFEKDQEPGTIGARTYKEIFKLLLRLRANIIWPAMHPSTKPFYFVAGAKETADSFGIAIGTSHCEPLMRNNVGEWKESERGPYNYITNRASVVDYWSERLMEAGGYENIYTIGMRGIHDGYMEGVKTMDERVAALRDVISDQRSLLRQYVDTAVTSVPQIFIPYKEVLEIMDNGLEIPEDVTLVWCDDNYGHISRLSDSIQQQRKGGAGIYYHLSYWGRPHDYLWLGTTQPGLVYKEMSNAYCHNARKIWIANVHDLKTSSYPLELFLDMAWDIDAVKSIGVGEHLALWLEREFGEAAGTALMAVMYEYYRLGNIRRPEHTGWSQVELNRKIYPRGRSQVGDTDFSFTEFGGEADRYLEAYDSIILKVNEIEAAVRPERHDTYFAQMKYPVSAAGLMARKMLEAQRARSYAMGQSDASLWGRDSLMFQACARSMDAYQKIRRLTAFYNDSLAAGKWKHSMCMNPRDLCVFNPPVLPVGLTEEEIMRYLSPANLKVNSSSIVGFGPSTGWTARNGDSYDSATFSPAPVFMLGHSMNAVPLPKGESLMFDFDVDSDGKAYLLTALIPTQPTDNGELRIAISIDGGERQTVSIREKGRTDRWKENVLRNQARVTTAHDLKKGRHRIAVTALDDNIILDQLMLDSKKDRKFYVVPVSPSRPR